MNDTRNCPKCNTPVETFRNPFPTVDAIIQVADVDDKGPGVVLIERSNPPYGWALPGGFVDYGESCEQAAVREMKEETNLDVVLSGLFGVYSDPDRDSRFHTVSVVYLAVADDISRLRAGDDAGKARIFPLTGLPKLAFDHGDILDDYRKSLNKAERKEK